MMMLVLPPVLSPLGCLRLYDVPCMSVGGLWVVCCLSRFIFVVLPVAFAS